MQLTVVRRKLKTLVPAKKVADYVALAILFLTFYDKDLANASASGRCFLGGLADVSTVDDNL